MKRQARFLCLFFLSFLMMRETALATPSPQDADSAGTSSSASAAGKPSKHEKKQASGDEQWPAISNAFQSEMPKETVPGTESPMPEADASSGRRCGYLECIDLVEPVNDVYYTVKHHNTVAQIAPKWGVPAAVLLALNPGLTLETMLEPGRRLLAEARLDSAPEPYSRGKTNRGRLSNGRPMPEGKGYFLRTAHPNSWGTDNTVRALMTMFAAYHEKYPDGPDVNMGDISRRRGGRLRPHKSHQAGRDVDFGFVHTVKNESKRPETFMRADESNLDVEKTWFLIASLIRTGEVKVIYVDIRVQKMLYQYAAPLLTAQQREAIFSFPRRETSSSAMMQHWPGHRNHFHVRFRCPRGQLACRE